ncbi:DNA repair protein RecO [Hazenella coriacea]|uniref:DNA repair protein RecO n=1 Tax=Hazenella coriacea TaxID=1179467 RepID=A0A4R3L959_9BACL|nr:DNA repair protein RecO [Hazenella coriacea]TCS94754.1 DNA replication and repair protein RecO [Hazenella coriacea]
MLKKVEGIVLKTKDYGESHQIVIIFSETLGKVAFMARGSKKTRSRFGAVTEPFSQALFVFFMGSGMATLSQADLIHSHHQIRSDLLLTAYGAYWLDIMDKVTEEKESHPSLYHFLVSALQLLEQGTDPEILTRIVELRVMDHAGFRPVLHQCVQCQSTSRPVRFSIRQGGFLCKNCVEIDPQSFPVTEAVAKIFPLLHAINIQRLGEVNVKTETNRQLEKMIQAFMDEYLSIPFKSRSILKQIQKSWDT